MTDDEKYRGSALERHLQSAFLLLGVGVLGWVGHTVDANNINQARMEERSAAMKASLDDMKKTMTDDMYKRSDAKHDVDTTNQQISEVRSRVSALESVLNARSRPVSGPVADWSRK